LEFQIDFEELNKTKWCAHKDGTTFYAVKTIRINKKEKTIKMHRVIMNTPHNMKTDHIDGNGLNNQRSNLRIVTARQNGQNIHINKSSQYVGVYWHKRNKKWRASININKKVKYLGNYTNELEAHKAYLRALDSIGEVFIDNL
jgi:hypothetical protein